jgi:hypothetical protein
VNDSSRIQMAVVVMNDLELVRDLLRGSPPHLSTVAQTSSGWPKKWRPVSGGQRGGGPGRRVPASPRVTNLTTGPQNGGGKAELCRRFAGQTAWHGPGCGVSL